MGSQLRWLERTPDKREVDGSIPFEPTNFLYFYKKMYIENYIEKAKKVNQHIGMNVEICSFQYDNSTKTNNETMLNIEKLLTMKKNQSLKQKKTKTG